MTWLVAVEEIPLTTVSTVVVRLRTTISKLVTAGPPLAAAGANPTVAWPLPPVTVVMEGAAGAIRFRTVGAASGSLFKNRSCSTLRTVSMPSGMPAAGRAWFTITAPSTKVMSYSVSAPLKTATSALLVAALATRISRTATMLPGSMIPANTACCRVMGLPTW